MSLLILTGIRKRYGARTVLDIDDFQLEQGCFFALLGPSGSGKTTLLRIIAGLVRPDAGELRLGGEDVLERPPHERGVGVVFQGLALWPHLTVRGNLALGLDRDLPDPAERTERIRATAEALHIESFLDARPGALSGGERQRVALARALVRRPALLLLDEPFSDLDAPLRISVGRLVKELHQRFGMTTLLITHDRQDAYLLADRIGLLRAGRIVGTGAPDALHADPGSAFAASFLTDAALVSGTVAEDGLLETVVGRLPLESGPGVGERALVALRPEEITLGSGDVRGTVAACEFAGGAWRCRVHVGETELVALHASYIEPGTETMLQPSSTLRRALREDA